MPTNKYLAAIRSIEKANAKGVDLFRDGWASDDFAAILQGFSDADAIKDKETRIKELKLYRRTLQLATLNKETGSYAVVGKLDKVDNATRVADNGTYALWVHIKEEKEPADKLDKALEIVRDAIMAGNNKAITDIGNVLRELSKLQKKAA